MSSNTRQVLAIVLGALGLTLGVLGTLTAYNAKQATDTESEVSAEVSEKFDQAQAHQDEIEKRQASDAERLVAGLNRGEKSLLGRIHANTNSVKALKRHNGSLGSQIETLTNRDQELGGELASLESDQNQQINQLNRRINKLNGRLNKQENRIQRMQGQLDP